MAIKSQLDIPKHPLNILIQKFYQAFIEQHRMKVLYQTKVAKEQLDLIVLQVKIFRESLQNCIVRFYELGFTGPNDINIQLLQNMVTSIILRDEFYVFLMCAYIGRNYNDIKTLKQTSGNSKRPNTEVMPSVDFGGIPMKDEFKLNMKHQLLKSFREEELGDALLSGNQNQQPYNKTITQLRNLKWIQCPIEKLNFVYACLFKDLPQEID